MEEDVWESLYVSECLCLSDGRAFLVGRSLLDALTAAMERFLDVGWVPAAFLAPPFVCHDHESEDVLLVRGDDATADLDLATSCVLERADPFETSAALSVRST